MFNPFGGSNGGDAQIITMTKQQIEERLDAVAVALDDVRPQYEAAKATASSERERKRRAEELERIDAMIRATLEVRQYIGPGPFNLTFAQFIFLADGPLNARFRTPGQFDAAAGGDEDEADGNVSLAS